MQFKKWFIVELVLLTTIYLSFNYLQLSYSPDYTFFEAFNSRDGSLYFALLNRAIANGLIFFTVVYYGFPKLLAKRRWQAFSIFIAILFTVACVLQYFGELFLAAVFNLPENLAILYPNDGFNGIPKPVSGYSQIRSISAPIPIFNGLILFVTLIYGFIRDWWRNVHIQGKLQEEKLSAELNFLRSQINPHFLFNTLNNIFYVARKNNDEETAELIAKLADMLRYMLAEIEEEQVDIQDEIRTVENLIEIIKLRYAADEIEVKFTKDIQSASIKIAPLLFLPFVENAFKYGVSIQTSSVIDIELSEKKNDLIFTIKNKIYPENKTGNGNGSGVNNVRKRLQLLYPNKHELSISMTDFYIVYLRLELN